MLSKLLCSQENIVNTRCAVRCYCKFFNIRCSDFLCNIFNPCFIAEKDDFTATMKRGPALYCIPLDNVKVSEDSTDYPPINLPLFSQNIWYAAPPQLARASTAILETAQRMPDGIGTHWVTPAQMGHLAASMGAGYVSGMLVGKALGALTGMPEETQERLAQTGMYAGIVKALLPKLF